MTKYLAAILLSTSFGGSASAAVLDVKVDGIETEKGSIVIRVFKDEAAWLKNEQALETRKIAPSSQGVSASFDLPPGPYALHVFQDENSNDKLDMKWLPPGPAEPWVVSNNAQGTIGPPSFKDAKFEVEGAASLTLKLQ